MGPEIRLDAVWLELHEGPTLGVTAGRAGKVRKSGGIANVERHPVRANDFPFESRRTIVPVRYQSSKLIALTSFGAEDCCRVKNVLR